MHVRSGRTRENPSQRPCPSRKSEPSGARRWLHASR
ncbi:hypothetical protein [Caudoviricetes sp.]|nr:hypothetical protein [Caudoviricetes sp.]